MKSKILKIHERDNVIVALQDLEKGADINIDGKVIFLTENIPAKHKFFTTELSAGDEIIMYGVLVGKAQQYLLPGSRMTTDNVKHAASPYGYRHVDFKWQPPDVSKFKDRTFNGYHRSDGRVGTANYWLF